MKINEIIARLEHHLSPALQEKWDHGGFNLGDPQRNITGVLFAYDACLEVIAHAKSKKCGLVITHHPFRMRAPVNLRLDSYEGRLIQACLKNDIALYSAHTHHDSSRISLNRHYLERLGLDNILPLARSETPLFKLVVFVPETHTAQVVDALFQNGAGGIGNYSECSFRAKGTGTFKGNTKSNPRLGKRLQRESAAEERVEVLVPGENLSRVISAMKTAHPYEEVAYDILRLENTRTDIGSGAFGSWRKPQPREAVLKKIKTLFNIRQMRFVDGGHRNFKKVGICTGAGASLMPQAIAKGCDLFITGDVKYHQAIDARRDDLSIADIGHFASEIHSVDLLKDLFAEIFGKKLRLESYKNLKDAFQIL